MLPPNFLGFVFFADTILDILLTVYIIFFLPKGESVNTNEWDTPPRFFFKNKNTQSTLANGTPPVFFFKKKTHSLKIQESDEQLMNFGLRDQLEALRWIQEMLGFGRLDKKGMA